MDYPARLELEPADEIGRWRPLFQWVLAIPHFVVMYGLGIVAEVVGIVSWFAILFTGKMPSGLADVQCMVQRYNTRVGAYAAGLHDEYPPFGFASTPTDPGDHRTRVSFTPELEGRNRLTVALRLIWMIPAAIVTFVICVIGVFSWLIGAFAVLFTGRWPVGLRTWVEKSLGASLRLSTYQYLLTDRYPPMRIG